MRKIFFAAVMFVSVASSLVWAGSNPARQSAQQRGTEPPADGVWYVYDRKGYLLREEHYGAYRLNGEVKTFFPSGGIKEITQYLDNTRQGATKTYYENGGIESDSSYEKNNLSGLSKHFYNTGEFESESYYVEGRLDGEKKSYYKTGVLKQIAVYAAGALNGTIRNYGEDGKMVSEEIYDHGALISRKEIKADVASAADASASAVLVSGAKEIKPEPAKGAPQTQAPAPQTPPPAKK